MIDVQTEIIVIILNPRVTLGLERMTVTITIDWTRSKVNPKIPNTPKFKRGRLFSLGSKSRNKKMKELKRVSGMTRMRKPKIKSF